MQLICSTSASRSVIAITHTPLLLIPSSNTLPTPPLAPRHFIEQWLCRSIKIILSPISFLARSSFVAFLRNASFCQCVASVIVQQLLRSLGFLIAKRAIHNWRMRRRLGGEFLLSLWRILSCLAIKQILEVEDMTITHPPPLPATFSISLHVLRLKQKPSSFATEFWSHSPLVFNSIFFYFTILPI